MIEYLPLVMTGIGIIVSILYYTSVLRNAIKTQRMQLETRQGQLYNNLFNQSLNNPNWQKNAFIFFSQNWNNVEEFLELFPYGEPTNENTMALWSTSIFFEGMVPLIREGLLEVKYLDGAIGDLLNDFWRKMETVIDGVRESWNEPTMFNGTEYIVNEMKKHQET